MNLLGDELVYVCRLYQMYKKELAEAEAHPESDARTKKIEALTLQIQKSEERQSEIDQETEKIERAFKDLRKVDIPALDHAISQTYRQNRLAESGFDLAKETRSN